MKKKITVEHRAWVEVARSMAEHPLCWTNDERRAFGLCFEVDTMYDDMVISRYLSNLMAHRINENMDCSGGWAFPMFDRDVRVLAALFLAIQAAEGI